MESGYLILHGGSDDVNDDYSRLSKLADSGKSYHRWSCLKNAGINDQVFFYISSPNSAIVAEGVVLSDPKPGKNWPYEAQVGQIRMLESPIGLQELRQMFPRWKWLKQPRASLYLDRGKARKIVERAKQGKPTSGPESEAVERGAGFGDADNNRLVEQAAIRFVSKDYQKQGYQVESRESENVGYDLSVTKGRRARIHNYKK